MCREVGGVGWIGSVMGSRLSLIESIYCFVCFSESCHVHCGCPTCVSIIADTGHTIKYIDTTNDEDLTR